MRLPVLASCLALAFAGCGSDDEDEGAAPASAPETSGNTVAMKNIEFKPAQLTVKAGDTVTWVNQEGVDHNVVATEGATFKSDTFGQDGTFEFKTEKAGTISYVCTLHPGMDGTLTVASPTGGPTQLTATLPQRG